MIRFALDMRVCEDERLIPDAATNIDLKLAVDRSFENEKADAPNDHTDDE
ncbi:MAG: hypothetical protein ACAI34_05270 [Verrucomicrobium sp.]|nr:hypothetical protein [Verrucomicrobium sp.]